MLKVEYRTLVQAVKALVENRIDELVKKPVTIINEEDKEGVLEFAHGLMELGKALTATDNNGL